MSTKKHLKTAPLQLQLQSGTHPSQGSICRILSTAATIITILLICVILKIQVTRLLTEIFHYYSTHP